MQGKRKKAQKDRPLENINYKENNIKQRRTWFIKKKETTEDQRTKRGRRKKIEEGVWRVG